MPDFQDRALFCTDCHNEFVFTAGEQMFFAEKQFKNDPRRCKTCKAQRLRATAALAKGDPTKLTVSTVQTEVCCASCGILTSVPFKPVRNLPVFCRACFSAGRQSAQTSAPSGPRESASA